MKKVAQQWNGTEHTERKNSERRVPRTLTVAVAKRHACCREPVGDCGESPWPCGSTLKKKQQLRKIVASVTAVAAHNSDRGPVCYCTQTSPQGWLHRMYMERGRPSSSKTFVKTKARAREVLVMYLSIHCAPPIMLQDGYRKS